MNINRSFARASSLQSEWETGGGGEPRRTTHFRKLDWLKLHNELVPALTQLMLTFPRTSFKVVGWLPPAEMKPK